MARKMILVDQALVDMIRRRDEQQSSPELDQILRLDTEMKDIFGDKKLSLSEKVTRYNNVLQEYLQLRQDVLPKSGVHLRPPVASRSGLNDLQAATPGAPAKEEAETPILPVRSLLHTLPKLAKKRGEQLYEMLSKSGRITWNKDFEVIIDGDLIPNSNIADLVYDATVSNKTSEPTGWGPFTDILNKVHVPAHIRANKRRLIEHARQQPLGGEEGNEEDFVDAPKTWLT